jgi:NAD(P)-dependent dehydrogenase (short-subunit alcohol dehydrogenase family)
MNYLEKNNNSNKTAFVVGGLGAIGFEVSRALYDSGAKVVIVDVKNVDKKIKLILKKYQFEYYKIDYQGNNNLNKHLKKIFRKYSTPDIFVNCSYPKTKDWKLNSFKNIKLEELKKNISLHLISFCWIAKQIADEMKRMKKNGSIIQLGSIYGLQGQDMNLYKNTNLKENVSYSIIKGGIINFTRQMASYYGKHKIRVNNICPGGVKNIKDKNQKSKTFMNRYNSKTPLGKMAETSDVASAVLFLSSDTSSHITGQTLIIDGGISII